MPGFKPGIFLSAPTSFRGERSESPEPMNITVRE
jgi:hypothetical protein